MSKTTSFNRWIAMLLCLIVALGIVIPATAIRGTNAATADRVLDAIQKEHLGKELDPNEIVRVSIVLEKKSTLEAGYSTLGIANNKNAMKYRDSLRAEQATVQTAIERRLNKDLDVVWNLTLAANIISANVRRGDIVAIKGVDGVESVYVEKQYSPDVVSVGGTADPNMAIAGMIDGAQDTWLSGYTGEGALIAIIDTGLDINHQSFDNGAFLAAVNKANLKLDEETVKSLAAELNAVKSERATADQLYRNEKVPFGWNYIDSSAEITHDNDSAGEHGSHVAGIAAANRLVDTDGDGEYEDALKAVHVAGNAPDAQIMVMKVFGRGGGAYDSDCAAAIEDAIFLGADAVNLSLGMALPGFAAPQDGDPYAAIQELLVESDTVVVFSAGNAGSWAENTYNGYLYNDGVSYQFGGESGSYTNSFTVASVENGGFIGATFGVNGKEYGFNETDGYGNPPFGVTLDPDGKGTTYKFVMVEAAAAGHDDEFLAALPAGTIDDKTIYITWRGVTSFFVKGNAGYNAGAAAVIVGNNQPGIINMDLTGYEGDIPVVSTLQANAIEIWESVADKQTAGDYQYITGTITVNGATSAHAYNTGYYNMSDFSSWGTTGDLALKPEISAFGGSILSVWGSNKGSTPTTAHDQYELMSGTSMAAPQITGMSALVQQYLRDKDYDLGDVTSRAITMGLLMATAEPMKDADGNYYSLLQQGAGLANVNHAVSSPVYITVKGQKDGKVKAELGDDFTRDGVYVVEFDIHNLTGEYYTYELDLDAFTQAYFAEEGYGEFLDYATRALDVNVTYEIDGELFTTTPDLRYDFDNDGDFDDDDAQLLLDYIIKGTALKANEENADVNGDGVVDTYDVHVLLNTELPAIKIGADTVHVKATITLTDEEKETLDEQNPGGAYIEAFLFVQPVADEEGVLAPELSIPVLAYYGSWTDASMYEVGTGEDWYNRTGGLVDGRYPYTYQGAYSNTYNLTMTNVLLDADGYILLNGDGAGAQGDYMDYMYTQIRNSGNGVVQVTDQNGKLLWRSEDFGADYGVTYYENAGFWLRPSLSGSLYYNLYNYAEIDWAAVVANMTDDTTAITVSLILAPEYYAQYDYDWDALTDNDPANGELGAGAFLSTTLTIDLEPPVVESLTFTEVDGVYTIIAKVSDNVSVVDVTLVDADDVLVREYNPSIRDGSRTGSPNFTVTGPGESKELTFDGYYSLMRSGTTYYDTRTGALKPNLYIIEVTDSSGNTTTQEILVGLEPTDTAESIVISETEISLLKSSTYQLTAKVGPVSLNDKSVKWSSSDPNVATVDPETGVVTAVGVGTATITATSNATPGVTATCKVEVFTLPIVATGILGDETGYAKFFEWDFEEGTLDYSDAEEHETVYPQAVTTYKNGTFLAVDGDGTMYEIDAEGNQLQSSVPGAYDGYLPYDMDYTDDAGFWWTMWGYLLQEEDPFAPEMYGFNLGTYGEYIGLAIDDSFSFDTVYQGSLEHVERTIYLLTTDNQIVEIYLYNGGQNALIAINETDLTAKWVGYGGESYSNMVLGNDGNLYASIMTGDTNEVYQLSYWETDTDWGYTALYLGDFGDGVWPGLFLTVENKPTNILYDFNNDGVTDAADAQMLLRAVVRETTTDDMDVNKDGKVTTRDVYDLLVMIKDNNIHSAPVSSMEASKRIETAVTAEKIGMKQTNHLIGSLNSVGAGDPKANADATTVLVPITAGDVNNGLFALTYDADELTYFSNKTPSSAYTQVYVNDDVIRVGFAGLDTLAPDTVVAEIAFTYTATADSRDVQVTLSVLEDGETYYEDPANEDITVTLPAYTPLDLTFSGILMDGQFFTYDGITRTDGEAAIAPSAAGKAPDGGYYAVSMEDGDLYKLNSAGQTESVTSVDGMLWDAVETKYGIFGIYGTYLIAPFQPGEFAPRGSDLATYDPYVSYLAAITVAEQPWEINGYSGDLVLYVMDDYGWIWPLYLAEENGEYLGFLAGEYSNDLPVYPDPYGGNSLVYGEDGVLYASILVGNDTEIYSIEINDDDAECTSTLIGTLGYAGLITDVAGTESGTNAVRYTANKVRTLAPAASANVKEFKDIPMVITGGLNSIEIKEDSTADSKTSLTVPVYASASTNGEFILTYDPDVLELASILDGAVLTSYEAKDGMIHVGYAAKNTADGMVVNAEFNIIDPDAATTTVTLTVLQDGENKTEVKTETELELVHTWNAEPEFTWSDDGKTASATFTCEHDSTHTETVEATVTSEVKTAATCEAAGTTTYTATVEFNGETYTDTKDVEDITALGHSYGEPTFTWSDDGKTATATFTCANNEAHTETVKATVTSEVKVEATATEDGTTLYTAKVEFNGKTFTDTKEVKDIPATGNSPETGDNNHVVFWASLILLSLFGVYAIVALPRKVFDEGR